MGEIPGDFVPLDTASPFNRHVGPYHCCMVDKRFVLGLLIEEKHCNSAGRLHGGMMSAIADIAIGHNVGLTLAANAAADQGGGDFEISDLRGAPKAPIATVSMSSDFVGTAGIGDWVEVHVDVQKAGQSLAFANAYIIKDTQRIARISAVFKVFDT